MKNITFPDDQEGFVDLKEWPTDRDWRKVETRAGVTSGANLEGRAHDMNWRRKILTAQHSPIRCLLFSFLMVLPYWVSVHLCRHVHAQPYVHSQRNDRQSEYDRTTAPQNQLVRMIYDVNAEELMTIARKRLCQRASPETRSIVNLMCWEVIDRCPEFGGLLVPDCIWSGGYCHEMKPCGTFPHYLPGAANERREAHSPP